MHVQLIQCAIYRPIMPSWPKIAEQRDDSPYIYRRQRTDRTAEAKMAKVG